MKKLLTLLTMALMAIGVNAQTVIAEKDWTGCSQSDLLGFSPYDSGGSVEATADGVAITISKKSAEVWQPQTIVLDGATLDWGSSYQVVIIAKIPSDGQIQVNMGNWSSSDQYLYDVTASENYQEIVVEFLNYPCTCNGDAHIYFQTGWIVGTTIVKKVELIKGLDTKIGDYLYRLDRKKKTAELKGIPQGYNGSMSIPSTVTYRGVEYTITQITGFSGCAGLTSVTIPSSVTTIGYNAFQNCTGLTSLSIPSSVTTIGGNAFYGCTGLNSVTIPNSVTSIGVDAFNLCIGLTSLTIPNSVTSIGKGAFQNCIGLSSVTVQCSPSSVGTPIFSGCPNLKECVFDCEKVTPIFSGSSIESITMTKNVTSIGKNVISGCTNLSSLTIPSSVTSFDENAFADCSCLTSVSVQCTPASVGASIFEGCTNLKDGIFDCSTVTPLFKGSSIKNITIGESVTSVQERALAGLDKIEEVICLAENVPTTDRTAFENSYIDYATLKVPVDALEAYKTTAPWSGFKQIEAAEGNLPEDAEKCATPTIMFANGTLTFSCQTEGVEYKYKIENPDVKDGTGNDIKVAATYKVSVFAFKTGWKNSDTATLEITASGKPGDANGDGVVNAADVVKTVNIIMGN